MPVPEWLKALGASSIPHIGGIAGAFITAGPNRDIWYDRQLQKPSWRPPNWAFAPVWTALYTGMGYASYLVYRDGGGLDNDATRIALGVYAGHLALNWAFTPLFFGAKNLAAATADIIATTAAAGATGILFYKINNVAGYLFIPYMAWLSFASAVCTATFLMNRKPKAD